MRLTIQIIFADGEGETLGIRRMEDVVADDGDTIDIQFDGCGLAEVGEQWAIVVPIKASSE